MIQILHRVLTALFAPAVPRPACVAEAATTAAMLQANHAAWPASPDENELRTAAYYLAEADGFKQNPDVYWTQAIEKLA